MISRSKADVISCSRRWVPPPDARCCAGRRRYGCSGAGFRNGEAVDEHEGAWVDAVGVGSIRVRRSRRWSHRVRSAQDGVGGGRAVDHFGEGSRGGGQEGGVGSVSSWRQRKKRRWLLRIAALVAHGD